MPTKYFLLKICTKHVKKDAMKILRQSFVLQNQLYVELDEFVLCQIVNKAYKSATQGCDIVAVPFGSKKKSSHILM